MCRCESAGACGIPTFLLDLSFLLDASAAAIVYGISQFLTQGPGKHEAHL